MAGPMVTLACGKSSFTAWAIRCEVEWRMISSASGLFSVMISTRAPSCRGADKVNQLAVDLAGKGSLGQTGADGGGQIGNRGPLRQGPAEPSGSVTCISAHCHSPF